MITRSCVWLSMHVCWCASGWMYFYEVVFVCLCFYLCMCVPQSICGDCTMSWSHPIINTYRSSLGSADHLVNVRLPPLPYTHTSSCPCLWGFTGKAAYRRKKKAATDRWMDGKADRWILSDMTDWMTDWLNGSMKAGWLAGSLVIAVADLLTRGLPFWLMGPISYLKQLEQIIKD